MIVRVFRAGLLPASARKPRLIAEACRKTLRREHARDRAPRRGSAASKSRRAAAGEGEINIILLDRKAMRRMNKEFLGHDYDTDVIAFNHDSPEAFGDVYISAYKARAQAKELGHPVLREVLTLAVHGTLHLLGYDDDTPSRKARMFRKQDEMLAHAKTRRR